MKKDEINIMLIGLGPHAKRIYYPQVINLASEYNAKISAIVELEEKKSDVEEYLKKYSSGETNFIWVSKEETLGTLSPQLTKELDEAVVQLGINSVIISTEPLVHIQYADWAIKNNLHILLDKPLSTELDVSTDESKAKKLIEDYEDLARKLEEKRKEGTHIVFDMLAQRRFHEAFLLIKKLIDEVAQKTNMPISSISSAHSDGQWRMPYEIVDQHYHPYNQGYGKFSHSGYHTVDVVSWLLETTTPKEKMFDRVEAFSNVVRPSDFYSQFGLDDYKKIFPDYDNFNKYSEEEYAQKFKGMGEIDGFSSLAFKRRDDTMTLVNISAIHNGSSQRSWVSAEGKDLYKGNGRIRHESHYIVQGPFQSISFISYQSQELDPQKNGEDLYEVGGEYHLDIHVFRNNVLFPEWEAYKKYSVKDFGLMIDQGTSRGHQEDARRICIKNFFNQIRSGELNSHSSFENHRASVYILSAIYQSISKRYTGDNPVVSVVINNQ